ncbi:hypothetical protein LTR66_003637 [Elasticomyces elasticus]|nr:hypothetical protein LTR66_003637 [Elasticomyces elasticus]
MHFKSIPPFAAAFSLAILGSVEAFWRMNCAVVHTGRVDPLVNPGALAAHAHTIVGGSNIGVNATYSSLLNSQCTSCEITADKSAYWTPLLYYQHANGSFEDVPHGGSVIYYLGRGVNKANIQPFPKGFMMLSGDKAARSYNSTAMTWGNGTYYNRPIADRVSFVCLTDGPQPPQQPYMFDTNCPNGMRAQIQFQSCWNGKDLYKADNSHVAYMSQIDDGICPPGYPVQFAQLFMETDYAVNDINTSDGGRFVFSQGDPTGYGFHGDFQNGWDMGVQTVAAQNCAATDNFGQISACPILQAYQTDAYAANCPEMPQQVGEKVHGLLDKLPGCINITPGPGRATSADMECGPNVVKAVISSTKDSVPKTYATVAPGQSFGLPGHNYLGCATDSNRTLTEARYTSETYMSVEFCQSYCTNLGYRYSGVEYGSECYCGNQLRTGTVFNSTRCLFQCNANGTEFCGGVFAINVYNNTAATIAATAAYTGVAATPTANAYNAVAAVPAAVPSAKNYLGCAKDLVGGVRTLSGDSTSGSTMTVEICAAYCAAGNNGYGYNYYGLEYSSQCFCGNTLPPMLNLTSTPSNGTCSQRCAGNTTEICGGPSVLSMYNNTAYNPPKIASSAGKFVSKGCITDPNTRGRALQGASTTSSTLMTVDYCAKFCLGKNFHYAGVEYGQECYCDNQVRTSVGATATTCPTTSLKTCAGNKQQYCGGPALLNLYYSSTL